MTSTMATSNQWEASAYHKPRQDADPHVDRRTAGLASQGTEIAFRINSKRRARPSLRGARSESLDLYGNPFPLAPPPSGPPSKTLPPWTGDAGGPGGLPH